MTTTKETPKGKTLVELLLGPTPTIGMFDDRATVRAKLGEYSTTVGLLGVRQPRVVADDTELDPAAAAAAKEAVLTDAEAELLAADPQLAARFRAKLAEFTADAKEAAIDAAAERIARAQAKSK